MGKKFVFDTTVESNARLGARFSMLTLQLPDVAEGMEVLPGQFVQVKVPDSASTYLRRPISICSYDPSTLRMKLLIRRAGEGSEHLCNLPAGSVLNIIAPLGNGFTLPAAMDSRVLLVGGGVGVAPMFALGRALLEQGITPQFLLGARTESELLLADSFRAMGTVHISTDDGSAGQQGFAADNSVMSEQFDMVYTCGPKPMMVAVARKAKATGSSCQVSLENLMACGLGACLCCVEPTVKGNLCACVDGPVFPTDMLQWKL